MVSNMVTVTLLRRRTYRGPSVENNTIAPYTPNLVSSCCVLCARESSGGGVCVHFPMDGKGPARLPALSHARTEMEGEETSANRGVCCAQKTPDVCA